MNKQEAIDKINNMSTLKIRDTTLHRQFDTVDKNKVLDIISKINEPKKAICERGGRMKSKFRAWDEDSQKMNGNVEIYIAKDKTIEVRTKDDKTILMQSTWLFDKNGKEIYEGDIIKFSNYYDDVSVTPVVWDKNYACFGASFSGAYPISFDYLDKFYTDFKDIEVIGNVYENPDFLDVK